MQRKMTVVLDNRLEELHVLTQMLQAFLQPYALPTGTIYALELSLEEIFVNIISYAYEKHTRRTLQCEVVVDNDMVGMTFIDEGRPFNPLAIEQQEGTPPPAEQAAGGLGISFVRHMRDMMEYQRQEGRNILRLWFHREAAADGGGNPAEVPPVR